MGMDLLPSQGLDIVTYHQWLKAFPNAGTGDYSNLVSRVLFLCSNAASSLTGQVMFVDPGIL
jgi:enoyl-[acyl-carrier-protein] reductase (NADH)